MGAGQDQPDVGIGHIGGHRCGGRGVGCRRGRYGIRCGGGSHSRGRRGDAGKGLDAVTPYVIGFAILADGIPAVFSLGYGIAGQHQYAATAFPVVCRVIGAVGAGAQVAAGQNQLHHTVLGVIGDGSRGHGGRNRRGGGRRGSGRHRGAVLVGIRLHTVIPDVVGFAVLGDRIPGVASLLNGIAGQQQDGSLSRPVIIRIIVAVRADTQVAAGQGEFHMGIGGGVGGRGRGGNGGSRNRGDHNRSPVLRTAAENGNEVAHDIADIIAVFDFIERIGAASADGGDGQQFHLGVAVQAGDAVIAGAGAFTQVGAACGNGTDGSGNGRQVNVSGGGNRRRRRGRSISVGNGDRRGGGGIAGGVVLCNLFGSQFTEKVPVDIARVFITVLPGRIDGFHLVPKYILDRFGIQNGTDMVGRQSKGNLLVGTCAIAHVDLIQRDSLAIRFRIGRVPASCCGRDQREQHTQHQRKAQETAAIHGHEWFTSTFFFIGLKQTQRYLMIQNHSITNMLRCQYKLIQNSEFRIQSLLTDRNIKSLRFCRHSLVI